MKNWKLVASFLLGVGLVHYAAGANWYVDSALRSGANNGSSWNSAWRTLGNIAWGNVKAGDTVYISGGTSSTSYASGPNITASGTAESPITITVGQEPGHNGQVIINGSVQVAGSYITIDGSVAGQSRLKITARGGTAILGNAATGLKVNAVTVDGASDGLTDTYFDATVPIIISNSKFLKIASDHAIYLYSAGFLAEFDKHQIYNNEIEVLSKVTAGADGIQAAVDGLSIHDNLFRVTVDSSISSQQHPDYVQVVRSYIKIYNNEFVNIGDSAIDFDAHDYGIISNLWIFNNVFRITQRVDTYPQYIRFYSTSGPMISLGEVKILNNTFVDNTDNFAAIEMYQWNGGNPTAAGVEIKNNIFNNCKGAFYIGPSSGFAPDSFSFSNNVYHNPGPTEMYVTYGGVSYPASQWVSQFESSGSIAAPLFVNYTANGSNNNYHLQLLDTAARDKGTALDAYFTTDKDGVPRPQISAWDIGAYEYLPPGPLHTLTVALFGTGNGTIYGAGISCPGTCSVPVIEGSQVDLHAIPAPDSVFSGWSGDCGGASACSLVVGGGDASVGGTFTLLPPGPPVIPAQPQSQTAKEGSTASFKVYVSGNPAVFTYQWQKNSGKGWSNISGAVSASYTTPKLVKGDDGSWFRVVVANSLGTATSAPALLTVVHK